MRSIAVYSLKGGVGKTTLAVNLAWAAATRSARKTLLWDLDAQSAASYLLGADADGPSEAQGVFAKEVNPAKLVQTTATPRLDLLAADASLRGLDHFLHDLDKKKRLLKLIERLGQDYDRIILDAPPGLTDTSEQVLRAADLILVPLIPSPLSQRAFDEVLAFLDRNQIRHGAGPAGLQHGRPSPLASPRRARRPCRLAGRADGERVRGDERVSGRRRPAACRLAARSRRDGAVARDRKAAFPLRLMKKLDPDLLLRAYAIGVFPMSDSRDARDVYWVEPRRRAIIPLDGFHVSKSLRKTLRSDRFEVTLDRAFGEVVRRCAAREDTWINDTIEAQLQSAAQLGSRPFGRGLAGRRARRRSLRRPAGRRLLRRKHVLVARPTPRRWRSPGWSRG